MICSNRILSLCQFDAYKGVLLYMSRNKEMALMLLRMIIAKRTKTAFVPELSTGSISEAASDAPANWLPAQQTVTSSPTHHVFDWNTEERVSYTP